MKQQKAGLPNTYFVQDMNDEKEVERLIIQDEMITGVMGGVLPEQENPTFSRVLDIACGTGGWLMKLAQEYPIVEGQGVDVNAKMMEYARTKAEQCGLSSRVHFQVMDATLMLRFPEQTFDLVNLRLGHSFLRTWDWPKMISEMLRVTRPGGTVRLVESYLVPTSTSAALTEIFMTIVRADFASGRLREEIPSGMANQLAPMLHQYGAKDVQSKAIVVAGQQGTKVRDAFYQDVFHLVHTLRPFLHKFANVGKDFDELGRQALQDMQEPDFESSATVVVAWGKKGIETKHERFRDGD